MKEFVSSSILTLFSQWYLAGYIYTIFLVFIRVAAAISLLPGFGEQFISMRIKLFLAITLAVLFQPMVTPILEEVPTVTTMLVTIGSEFMIGILFGTWVRFMYLSLSIAAGFCAQVLGITNIFDASLEPGGAPALSGFLSFTALAFLSATGGHYFILEGFLKMYDVVNFRGALNYADASFSIIEAGTTAISLGLRLSLPFLVIGFLVNIGLGFVNRAMPQIPVFFVGQPLMIGIGFILLSLLISTMIFSWNDALRSFLLERL